MVRGTTCRSLPGQARSYGSEDGSQALVIDGARARHQEVGYSYFLLNGKHTTSISANS